MTHSDSSRPAAEACARVSRRRSLSEGCNIHLLTTITEEVQEPSVSQPQHEPDEHQFQHTRRNNNSQGTMELRSKSESFICTAQGIIFHDTKRQQYQTRLQNLMALAANPNSSKSNALLAQKALRYRNKTMERRRAYS